MVLQMNSNKIFIYGKHPVFLSLKLGNRKFYRIYTSNRDEINRFIIDNKIKIDKNIIEYKTINELNKIIKNVNHQGIIAEVSTNRILSLDDFKKNIDIKNLPKLLILDQLTDPHNVGAIIRTAVAFDVNYLIIPKHNSLKEYPIIAKASAGMSEMITIIEVSNLNNTIEILKNIGYFIIGMAGEASQDIKSIKDNKNLCLVIGSEGSGIRPLVKKNCDALYKITTNAAVESLNASVAAAIAIYKIWG